MRFECYAAQIVKEDGKLLFIKLPDDLFAWNEDCPFIQGARLEGRHWWEFVCETTGYHLRGKHKLNDEHYMSPEEVKEVANKLRNLYRLAMQCESTCQAWLTTRAEAHELASKGVRVDCHSPCQKLFDFTEKASLHELNGIARYFETIARTDGVLWAWY